ncbi:sensor histidine kinase [Amycolatopsis sp. EV170708-02-1]|uniref:sensor histidine kinase n=1 Tax=Amycolatopsis sp. EV170708-02-1 TaxID=2919322 RepID=UPI001F0C4019|nr:sensor histidine kinase [Amycolatopsis sp. EV170708-02-1]UMP06784.1 sensor histidine kinase [Amycolatopsis sp. EV170708-02-1]
MSVQEAPTAVASFVHQACIYSSDTEFLDMAMPFIEDGLACGEATLAVTTPNNIEMLTDTLGADADRVEFIDAYGWYRRPAATLLGYHDYYTDRHAERPGHVRMIGEPIWTGRSDQEAVEWRRYESILNVAFADSSAWIVCPYDARVLAPPIIADAQRTHPARLAGREASPCSAYVDPAIFVDSSDADPLPASPPDAAVLPFTGDLSSVRRFVTAHASLHGLPGHQAALLSAAVSEVANHVVQRGSGRATIRLWAESGSIVCDVHEPAGRITDPFLGYLPPTLDPAPGDGLWLTRQLSHLVETRSGYCGATVRLHMSGLQVVEPRR